MADEIRIALSFQANKGIQAGLNINVSRDLAGTNLLSAIQTVGTSAEAINIGDASGAKHMALQNLGQYPIDISIDSEGTDIFATLEIQPNGKTGGGDPLYIPCKSGVTYYAKATGGSSDMAVAVCEP